MTLHNTWVALEPMLRPAIALAPGNPRVLSRLMSGDAQLWGIYDDGQPIAAAVTGLLFSPKRCLVWLVGGSRIHEWKDEFMTRIEAWARSLGCVALYAESPRRGWGRIAKELGFTPTNPLNGFFTWERAL